MTKRCKGVLRLDKLMTHIKATHPECISAEGMSLLGMGFTITGADEGANVSATSPVDDDDSGLILLSTVVANEALDSLHVVDFARNTPPRSPPRRLASAATMQAATKQAVATATVENGVIGIGHEFWRFLTRSLDGVIQFNRIAKVIFSAEAIAAEVLRQQQI